MLDEAEVAGLGAFKAEIEHRAGAWWASDQPFLALEPVTTDTEADRIAAYLEGVDWRRRFAVLNDAHVSEVVDQQSYALTDRRRRYSICDVAMDADMRRGPLGELVDALTSSTVRASLESAVGVKLREEPWLGLSRYCHGAFLSGHNDVHDDRIVGLVVYFMCGPQGPGGDFFVLTEGGQVQLVPPKHNSAVLLRMAASQFHGVKPMRTVGSIRYALAIHFQREASPDEDGE